VTAIHRQQSINALADALSLDTSERNHLRYLAKITGDECSAHIRPTPPRRQVRPSVLKTLRLLDRASPS